MTRKNIIEVIAHLKEAKQKLGIRENEEKLKQELDEITSSLKNISEFGNYRSFELDKEEKGDDLLLVSVPGGERKRVNVGTLNNLVRQLNIVFAHFECPFKDNLDEKEKRDLIAEILKIKSEEVLIETEVDDANRAKDEDWEENEPQVNKEKGITEPTKHSYEWFKRWWKFHKKFPEVEFAYGTSEGDFSKIVDGEEKFPVLQEFPITEGEGNISWAKYKDPVKLIREKEMYKRKWTEDHLLDPEKTKGKYLLIQSYLDTVSGQERSVSPYKDFYAADFIHYFNTVFKNLDHNSLLYEKLGPEKMRDTYKYDVLHMVTWQLKSGKEDSFKYEDNETNGIKDATNSLDGWNYLELNDNEEYVHRFKEIKGIEGLIKVVEEVFYKDKKVLDKVIKQSGNKTLTVPGYLSSEKGPIINIYEEHLGKIFASYEEFRESPQETKEKLLNCLLSYSGDKDKCINEINEILKEEINRLEEIANSQTTIIVEPSKCRIT